MTKKELIEKGYVLYGEQYQCRDHGKTVEKYYLPNAAGTGVIDYQMYCSKHKRTLFENIELIK